MEKKITILEICMLLLLIIIMAAIRVPFTGMPLDRDEGTYAYMAQHIYHNELPYKDTFDQKPPFIYYIYKTAFDFFGISVYAIRTFTTLCVIVTMILVFIFMRHISGRWLSLLAALIYMVYQNNYMMGGETANTEVFLQIPLILSLLFLTDIEKKYAHVNFFISGIFIGIAVYIKTMVLFVFVAPVIYLIFYYKNKKDLISYAAWYTAGFLTITLLVLIWCVKNGILNYFIDCNIMYNLFYIGAKATGTNNDELFAVLRLIINSNALLLMAFLWSAYKLFKAPKDRVNFLICFSVITMYIGIRILKDTYAHYYMVFIPALAILAAIMFRDFYTMITKKTNYKAALTVLAVFFIANIFFFINYLKLIEFYKSGVYTKEMFYESSAVAEIINRGKTDKTTLFVWPNEPEIYFLTGIKAPSRFVYAYAFGYYQHDMETFGAKMADNPPDFFVLTRQEKEEAFSQLFRSFYDKQIETKDIILYKKKK